MSTLSTFRVHVPPKCLRARQIRPYSSRRNTTKTVRLLLYRNQSSFLRKWSISRCRSLVPRKSFAVRGKALTSLMSPAITPVPRGNCCRACRSRRSTRSMSTKAVFRRDRSACSKTSILASNSSRSSTYLGYPPPRNPRELNLIAKNNTKLRARSGFCNTVRGFGDVGDDVLKSLLWK